VVGLLGCLASAFSSGTLLSGRLQNNTESGTYTLCSYERSSYIFQSLLAWLAVSFFFLVKVRWQRLEQVLPLAVSAMN
jgi:hypothetical protein